MKDAKDKTPQKEVSTFRMGTQKKYKKITEQISIKNIGLDPTTGFGKALKQVYKGDVNNEALLEFAKQEYGYEAEGVAAQETPQPAQETAVQSDARARVEALENSSQSVVPQDASELLQKVTETGNTKDSIRTKLNLMEAQKRN